MARTNTQPKPLGVRERARAEITAEITATARKHLAEHGASGLSLRAVARDVGMVSSALYRYFPSRDALLTQLILDAYNALGDSCEAAAASLGDGDPRAVFDTVATSARQWATANPHEWALIYGTPVPGYAAPDDTVDPATRVQRLLVGVLVDIEAGGCPLPSSVPMAASLSGQLDFVRAGLDVQVSDELLARGLLAWIQLIGFISTELFGQLRNVFDEADALFEYQLATVAAGLGLATLEGASNPKQRTKQKTTQPTKQKQRKA